MGVKNKRKKNRAN